MVDDSHGTGVIGATGRGSIEVEGVIGRVDIVTSTLGKALGGASGGFTAASKEITTLLRQRSRPYLFSNSLPPVIVSGALYVLTHWEDFGEKRKNLTARTAQFRDGMQEVGFTIPEGIHPIVPVMLGDARVAKAAAEQLLAEGIYVIGFWYPVVPEGTARIRVQLSAVHTEEQVTAAIKAFTKVGKQLNVLNTKNRTS
jgi:glycine C-acetyltransferase